jgi:hypothetical protein
MRTHLQIAVSLLVATSGLHTARADGVPIQGTFASNLTLVTDPNVSLDARQYGGGDEGEGAATQLGKAIITDSVTQAGHGLDGKCPSGQVGLHLHHEFTLVAANGDELYGTFDIDSCGSPSAPTQFDGIGNVTFTGGTGRFAGATGSGTMHCHCEFPSPGFSLTAAVNVGTCVSTMSGTLIIPRQQ